MTLPDARVAHIGVAVADVSSAARFYRDVLGLPVGAPETSDGARIVSISFGDTDVELLEPVTPDGPIAKFLAKRGPGIHHICLRVPNLEAALERCRHAGYRLIDEHPRPGAGGRRVAFLHPKDTSGILLELTD